MILTTAIKIMRRTASSLWAVLVPGKAWLIFWWAGFLAWWLVAATGHPWHGVIYGVLLVLNLLSWDYQRRHQGQP